MTLNRLPQNFYLRDASKVAPNLLGQTLVRFFDNGETLRFQITEVEAYCGTEDLACHASKGRTARTEIMFGEGGYVYVYLIYGMYWLLNIVTGKENDASAVLIRGLENLSGPGRVGKMLQLNKSFYGENLNKSNRIWIENNNNKVHFITCPRVGIHYAGEPWISKPWRFIVNPDFSQ